MESLPAAMFSMYMTWWIKFLLKQKKQEKMLHYTLSMIEKKKKR